MKFTSSINYVKLDYTLTINYGLWVILICQGRFIVCAKCTSVMMHVDNREAMMYEGRCIYGKSLYLPHSFSVNLKTSLII
jgi:hypothetical protein